MADVLDRYNFQEKSMTIILTPKDGTPLDTAEDLQKELIEDMPEDERSKVEISVKIVGDHAECFISFKEPLIDL